MSLTTCLRKAGEMLDAEDRAAILARAMELRKAGTAADEAGRLAIGERLKGVRDELDAGPVVRGPLTDEAMAARLTAKIEADFDTAVAEYNARPDSKGGKILNTDTARELSPDYLADRTRSAGVHEPASQFIKDLYARKLAEAPKDGELPIVLFTAGGTGAGKTSAIKYLPQIQRFADDSQIIYDTNMNGYASSKKKIEQALQAGKDVIIAMVTRDPEDALVNGALPRAEGQRTQFGTGRTVPIGEHIKTHLGAVETVKRLAGEYAGNPRVTIRVVDNSLGKGKAEERPLSWLADLKYNDVERRVSAALERERAKGTISEATYLGFAGRKAATAEPGGGAPDRGVQARDRPSDGRRLEQEPASPETLTPALGRQAVALTERGTEIPVRWAVVDAGALVTSHGNDLRINPAYPQELQPRDRARAASEQQITRIQNDIKPELLGDSPKASDGAPIIGADGVVESGNARTIALRRAYASGKADQYRAWLIANADRFGLQASDLEGIRQPVLVRIGEGGYDRAEFARQANESAVAAMSQTEVAKADAARMPDLEGLKTNEDGTLNVAQSSDFIRAFVQQAVSPSDRGAMITAGGELSQQGLTRIRTAVFARAYGDSDLVAMMTESTDANVKNVLNGMMRAAPEVARLADLQAAGARAEADITGPLVAAVRKFSQLRADGMTVDQFMAQRSMFADDAVTPDVAKILRALQADARAPRRVADMISRMVEAVDSAGDPRQAGMFGDAPSKADTVAAAADRAATPEDAAIVARLAEIQARQPDLMVQLDGMDAPMALSEIMDRARFAAEEIEGEAPLVKVAAECALVNGF